MRKKTNMLSFFYRINIGGSILSRWSRMRFRIGMLIIVKDDENLRHISLMMKNIALMNHHHRHTQHYYI